MKNEFYELFFCDDIELYKGIEKIYPCLFEQQAQVEKIQALLSDVNVESRVKLLGYSVLRNNNLPLPNAVTTLGAVIELGMEEGLDVLAVYRDYSARYINYSGKIIIWDSGVRRSFKKLVDKFFAKAEHVVGNERPRENSSPQPPQTGWARLSFLTSHGLYLREGMINLLFADNLSGPVLTIGAEILECLIKAAQTKKS